MSARDETLGQQVDFNFIFFGTCLELREGEVKQEKSFDFPIERKPEKWGRSGGQGMLYNSAAMRCDA